MPFRPRARGLVDLWVRVLRGRTLCGVRCTLRTVRSVPCLRCAVVVVAAVVNRKATRAQLGAQLNLGYVMSPHGRHWRGLGPQQLQPPPACQSPQNSHDHRPDRQAGWLLDVSEGRNSYHHITRRSCGLADLA